MLKPRLSILRWNEPLEPRELADLIVQEYVEHYADYDRTAGRSADLAAIDLSRMDNTRRKP